VSFLDAVCARARARVADAARREPSERLAERVAAAPPPPSFAAALRGPAVAVIAEVKRASPSRGAIAEIPDPADLAGRYVQGGAAAVSVLTEPEHFRGCLDDLAAVTAAVPVPVLRKDFVVDGYQVLEARAAGAAAVLLIVAALSDGELAGLLETAASLGVEALVEVHDPAEAGRATKAYDTTAPAPPMVIGVNARDLATLTVDPGRFQALRAALPADAIAVAESGVRGAGDVRRLVALGADAVLVGEHVAAAADPAAAVAALVAAAGLHPRALLEERR
jgi:indole-3-glycerol phosphate synthase